MTTEAKADTTEMPGQPGETAVAAGEPALALAGKTLIEPSGEASGIAPEALAELRIQAAKAGEYWDRLLRMSADLENFKKRAARDRADAVRYANESLIEKLLPTLDNFDMALAASMQPQASTLEALRAGIQMVHTQMRSVLAEAGLEDIQAAGEPFDPRWHEAVSQQETPEVDEGRVVQQLRKGYKLREKMLRPATVVVGKKPAA